MFLDLDSLCSYADATPASQNMIEGQNMLNSGMIVMCGATINTLKKVEIYSLCLQTSALTSGPHEITGRLIINSGDENGNKSVRVEYMNCTCKAGTSHTCKHIVAVLLYCNR